MKFLILLNAMFVDTCLSFSRHCIIQFFKLIRTINYALILAAKHSTNRLYYQVECFMYFMIWHIISGS